LEDLVHYIGKDYRLPAPASYKEEIAQVVSIQKTLIG
jgi:hypothetical protein